MDKKVFFVALALLWMAPLLVSAELKVKMDQMFVQISELKPFITSSAAFEDPKNASAISAALYKMTRLSTKIKHEGKIKDSAKEALADSLHLQFKEAADAFEKGNKRYSLWMVRSNLSNCMSCHSQLPAGSTAFESNKKNARYTDIFQEAEFLYLIRNFDKAMQLYDRSLSEYPKNNVTVENLEAAVKRKLYYFSRVKRDLPELHKSLLKNLKNKALPQSLRGRIQSYAEAAKTLSAEKAPRLKSEAEIEAFATQTLKSDSAETYEYEDTLTNLRRLQLSGYLYEFLDQNPNTSLKPKIYYWLSFCESRWEIGLQDSLPEMYLKKCITEFPKSAIAPRCLKEYKELVTLGYSGSSGTHIPESVKAELLEMEKTIQGSKK